VSGRYPTPDDERVGPRRFSWTDLPAAGRKGKPPGLPRRGSTAWSAQTRTAGARLWATPQATQWDQTGVTLVGWAVAFEATVQAQRGDGRGLSPLLGELRQIEDRHGLSPKSMLQLRWRIVDDEDGGSRRTRPADSRKLVLLKGRKRG